MTQNSLNSLLEELNISLTYKPYKGFENIPFLNNLALAYNTINESGQFMLETNINNFPSSCTKKYIKDCLDLGENDLGEIKRINWQHFQDKSFVVADIETTGFSPEKGGQIIQIAAIKIDENGNELGKFNQFVKPTIKIPKKITDLTGITNDDVKNANMIGIVLKEFLYFFKGSTVVFHNAIFDWDRYIVPSAEKIGFKIPSNYPCIDTTLLSKYCFPNEKKHNLEVLCDRLNIEIKDHHNAYADVVMTSQAFILMRNMCKNNFSHLPYTRWIFPNTHQNHNICIKKVNRWDKWMPIKKEFSKLRLYIEFTYDNISGKAYYDCIEKHWVLTNSQASFDVTLLEQPLFKYFQVSSYDEILQKIPSKNQVN